MSEFRQDALRMHAVIIAEERAERPNVYRRELRAATQGVEVDREQCPFCPGNEARTPGVTAQSPPAPAPWRVRVTPNKFPAVPPPIDDCSEGDAAGNGRSDHWFQARAGCGRHEVIVESRDHATRCTELSADQTDNVWAMYQDRLAAVHRETSLPYARIFQNCGAAAGASIEHLHSQLIALPMAPNDAGRELARLSAWRTEHNRCGLLDLVRAELDEGARVVAEQDGLVAFCPFASRVPYEVWVTPREHQACFVASDRELVQQAGRLIRTLAERLDQSLQQPDYNYLIQTAPFDRTARENYHWRIELFPRLTIAAGFEMSSGCYINPVGPEAAARVLRG